MRMVTMREFRNNFAVLKEPVRVVRSRGNIEFVGTWTPEKENNLGHAVRGGDDSLS